MAKITNETRQKENESIMKHLAAIEKIVAKKCKRCDSVYGCLGCTFSSGELMGHIKESKELMEECVHQIQTEGY